MNKNFLYILGLVIIFVALVDLSVGYKPVRSLKYYRPKPWGYRRAQWHRYSHSHKSILKKRRPKLSHYPPHWRPERSRHQSNKEPFTIEFELPKYPENYSNRWRDNYQNNEDYDYSNDYIDEEYAEDNRQVRVQVLKEGERHLRIKLSRNDNFNINSRNDDNYSINRLKMISIQQQQNLDSSGNSSGSKFIRSSSPPEVVVRSWKGG
ncbi:uncharacterized protein LOC103573452 [Microplitis demolitor]|uniref:uncharacterized protein LOC103573452 n=1 Tax=Microplitis demolitor TaxID=69319 RepID=UPI0004CDA430|nr:uncharacterized protein LOC103573452 [Microplitis demolitor]